MANKPREIKAAVEGLGRRGQRAQLEKTHRRLQAVIASRNIYEAVIYSEMGGYSARVDNPVKTILRDSGGDAGCRRYVTEFGDDGKPVKVAKDSHRWIHKPTRFTFDQGRGKRAGHGRFTCLECGKVAWHKRTPAPPPRPMPVPKAILDTLKAVGLELGPPVSP